MRSVTGWKNLIKDKTVYAIALMAIEDLIGYRKTSLKRAEDADGLTNLLVALQEIAKGE